jgi:hypothetical protein
VIADVTRREVHMSVQSGDWVRTDSKGVWRVERAVPDHYEPRYRLSDRKELYEGTLFLLKRLLNDKWKPSFETTAAHESLVKPLNKSDSRRLQKYLAEDDAILTAFESFTRPVDAILNLGFALPRRSDYTKFKHEFESAFSEPLAQGITSDAILKVIAQSIFASCFGETPRDATLQFVSKGHEVRRRNLIYRELKVHNF